MKKYIFPLLILLLLVNLSSCKKLCIYCNCNFNTQENYEEEDCVSGFGNEATQIEEYDASLKAEKGYTYCDCYGVKK